MMEELLIKAGGRLWVAGNHKRIYLSRAQTDKLLEIEHREEGTIIYGNAPSPLYAKMMIASSQCVYYDANAEKFVVVAKSSDEAVNVDIASAIETVLNKMTIGEVERKTI